MSFLIESWKDEGKTFYSLYFKGRTAVVDIKQYINCLSILAKSWETKETLVIHYTGKKREKEKEKVIIFLRVNSIWDNEDLKYCVITVVIDR